MRKLMAGFVAGLVLAAGIAFAQSPGQIKLQSLVGPLGIATQGPGPMSTYMPVNGGTFTCNGATPVTVANTNIDAGSLMMRTLKTVGGTVGAYPSLQTITVGVGFTIVCTSGDTSIYNYAIFG